ncbi:hypothetical protein KW834_13285 [Pseudomonas sp. PDM29]|uniref:hypothetical protein n=1 Tax=Pseudomonas sp. PDM29 TaxID=2854771 RepID=UPI001C43C2E0|nr:hypothetical protein [Pseudomonas sp. PDM29]MBV7525383.1 hypothetical protein [Pseudomonas sp. PDM29]
MQPIQFFAARAEDGALLPGATVDVFVQGTQGRAPLFADSPCTVPLGNPVSADANARVFFYTTTPRIDMRISRYGYVAPLIVDISTWDAATAVEWVQGEIDAALGEIGDSLAEMETEFDADQADRVIRFNAFMDASGYEPPIPYAPGILLDRTTKTVSYLGNEYRAKGSFIPFTTSDWATDEAKLKLIGDDSLRQQMANPDFGADLSAWKDPVAPHYLKTVSDMKAGEPVSLFRLVPKPEWEGMQQGTSLYDCSDDINGAEELFHQHTIKGGVLEAPKGKFAINKGLLLRGGFTLRGAGKDVSTFVIGDSATVRLLGLGNTLERVCFHKDTPRENYITAGHKTDAAQTATLSEIGYCKFTAGQLAEFVNYALIANYRSRGIDVHHNRMFTYHLAFLTKYLSSDWVRLHANTATALNSANVFNSELFKIEAINQGWLTENHLISEGVDGALSCLTIESGASNLHVRGNTMKISAGYAVRVEHTDKTITPPTDCMLEGNTLIAGADALAVYSGSAQVSGLTLSGGTMTGPVTLYGTGTNVNNLKVRAGRPDVRTGVTLRGDDIKVRDLEVTGFGVGLANAAVSGLPDRNLDIRGLKMRGQTNEALHLKYLDGACYLSIDSVDNTSTSVNGAVYLSGGGEAAPADTLTVEPGIIIAPNTSGVSVNFMNGVTLGDCSGIKSPTRVKLTTTDAFLKFEATYIAAHLNNRAHRVNTIGKFAGKVVFNKDPKKPYFATGPLPADVWVDAAGVTTYTPI